VGETVSVKVRGADDEVRRLRGELVATDERGVTVHVGDSDLREHADYDQIIKARTVFEWGAAPKTPKRAKKKQQKEVAR
jgi:ribosome maturation factor RimP